MKPTDYCVFCQILAGKTDASFVYRDDVCAAIMDIQPVNPGHTLVIPTRHVVDLAGARPEEWAAVAETGRRVAAALRGATGVRCEGVNLLLADGAEAGQEVFHAHLHVIPRFEHDGFGLRFPSSYRNLPKRADLDAVASSITSVLAEE